MTTYERIAQQYTSIYSIIKLHCTALHCTTLHCTALHCTTLHCPALHHLTILCTALHCTALHCTTLHCPALHHLTILCTALHYTALHCTLHCTTHLITCCGWIRFLPHPVHAIERRCRPQGVFVSIGPTPTPNFVSRE